jgi:hypothetical protein
MVGRDFFSTRAASATAEMAAKPYQHPPPEWAIHYLKRAT